MQIPIFLKKKLPLNEIETYASLREMLRADLESTGDQIAVKFKRRAILHDVTYNELYNRVEVLGAGLCALEEGCTRAAVIAENSYDAICAITALLVYNGTVLPVDKELPFEHILSLLKYANCTTVIFDKRFKEDFEAHKKELAGVRNFICIGLKSEESTCGILSFDALIANGEKILSGEECEFTAPEEDTSRVALMTCKVPGETPTIVQFTEKAIIEAVCGCLRLSLPGERCMTVLPFDRPFVLIFGLLGGFACRSTLCIAESAKSFTKNLENYKPDYIFLSPLYAESIWQKIVHSVEKQGRAETMEKLVKTSNAMRKVGIDRRRSFFPSVHEMFGGNLKNVFLDGCNIDPEAVEFFDNVGIRLITGYGVAESACPVAQSPEKAPDFAAAGVLLPCVEVKIDQPDSEGSGEICVRGDVLMNGYFGIPSGRSTELSGWFHTGDLGHLSEKGLLYLDGTADRKILLKSGRTVYVSEIERKLLSVPGVTEASVYAGKNQKGAELKLCADITLEKWEKSPERIAEIKKEIDALNRTLPGYMRIDSVHIRKESQKENRAPGGQE